MGEAEVAKHFDRAMVVDKHVVTYDELAKGNDSNQDWRVNLPKLLLGEQSPYDNEAHDHR